jgi:hypothetical protein
VLSLEIRKRPDFIAAISLSQDEHDPIVKLIGQFIQGQNLRFTPITRNDIVAALS